jgi:hypothetical protein
MRYTFLFFLCVAVGIWSCRNNAHAPTESGGQIPPTTAAQEAINTTPIPLITQPNNMRLRATPGLTGAELAQLPTGSRLLFNGEVTDFTTKLKLGYYEADLPWLKVTYEGKEGWIFASGVDVEKTTDLHRYNSLLAKSLKDKYFSANIITQAANYTQQIRTCTTSQQFEEVYRLGCLLKDSMGTALQQYIEKHTGNEVPDLRWASGMAPGIVAQLVAEGSNYDLFFDYKPLLQVVRKTAHTDDDDFVELMVRIFKQDSVEHYFEGWQLQLTDIEGASLLGSQIHTNLLKQMDACIAKSALFEPYIREQKDNLIRDIVEGYSYWEPLSNIRAEIQQIIGSKFVVLTDADIAALKTRLRQFEGTLDKDIRINQKEGLQ